MPAYYNEHDPYATQWLRNLIAAGLIAPGEVEERDIQTVEASDLAGFSQIHLFAGLGGWSYALRLAGWPDDRPVLTASVPCQPFSAAGRGDGHADERHLWPHAFRLIAQLKPATVIGEQVEAAIGYGWLDGVFADLERAGYACAACVLPACSVGAPHIRSRIFWVADAERDSGNSRRFADQSREGTAKASAGAHAELGRCSGSGGLGDADSARSQGWRIGGHGTGQCLAGQAGVGFWNDYQLVHCADGKARRVGAGITPLVAGSAFKLGSGSTYAGRSRTGMLRAYGNSIVAQVAAQFIAAYMEVTDDRR